MEEAIEFVLESSEVKVEEELKSTGKILIGYLSAVYETDADISVIIYFKRSKEANWENTGTMVLRKENKRFLRLISAVGIAVSSFYLKAWCTYTETLEITSLQVSTKIKTFGNFA